MSQSNYSNNLSNFKKSILAKKLQLDKLGSIQPDLTKHLGEWMRLELTYSSNALEGNTLTRQETKLVVEEGISIGGKNIVEILEVKNHDQALKLVSSLSQSKKTKDLTQQDLLDIHSIILNGIDDQNAGKYRSVPVRISGSSMIPPNHLKVSTLMDELFNKIQNQDNSNPENIVDFAIEAHFDLVSIHPFTDGNGRTARLLFNLILLQHNFPMVFVATEERKTYLNSLEKAQIGGSKDEYYELMYQAVERSLDLYLDLFTGTQANDKNNPKIIKLLKIGELAKQTNEDVSTIRYWTKLGLLKIFNTTKSNYALYSPESISKVKEIRYLQTEKRLSLEEITELL